MQSRKGVTQHFIPPRSGVVQLMAWHLIVTKIDEFSRIQIKRVWPIPIFTSCKQHYPIFPITTARHTKSSHISRAWQ